MRFAVSLSDSKAEFLLQEDKKRLYDSTLSTTTAVDQFMVAADLVPRRFRTKWQQAYFEGPTARKDADSAERSRWISLLADLLRNTTTPMGRLLRESLLTLSFWEEAGEQAPCAQGCEWFKSF